MKLSCGRLATPELATSALAINDGAGQ
jgi:hypothetical protein